MRPRSFAGALLRRAVSWLALATLLVTARVEAADWSLLMESPQAAKLSTFAARGDGNFYECKVSGNDPNGAWSKIFHGNPGAGAIGEPSAHFRSNSSDVFVVSDNFRLFVRYWNGSVWGWRDQGDDGCAQCSVVPRPREA
jgi:hypothetical protein